MPRAIHLTEHNVDKIVEEAKSLGYSLSYLRDTIEYNAENGFDTYLVTDGASATNNITFTEFVDTDFHRIWKFAEAESPTEFVEITPK